MSVGYAERTETTQVASEATPSVGGASERFPGVADCLGRTDLEWVPAVEDPVVPSPQAHLCAGCPIRTHCLRHALATRAEGYWAGTTTADRATVVTIDDAPLAGVSQLVVWARRRLRKAAATHPVGAGSPYQYRCGCRCDECVTAKVAQRAQEKRRARQRKCVA